MRGIVAKINKSLKSLFSPKGQGLTEFVLILAFCAAIGYAAHEAGFGEAISSLLDSGEKPEYITAAIGGGKGSVTPTPTPTPDPNPEPDPDPNPNPNPDVTYNDFDWGTIDPTLYYKKEYKDETASRDGGNSTIDFTEEGAREDRILTDQQMLANLASHFIGLTQKQVSEMLKNGLTADMGKDNNRNSIVLGHLIASGKTNENGNKQGVKLDTGGDGKLKTEYANEIFKWMKNPSDPDSVTYDDTYMYLVSDYVVSQGWADGSGSNQRNGLHIQLEYDYSQQFETYNSLDEVKVVGVHIAIDPGSQKNAQRIAASNGQSSSGLDVQVRKTSDGTNQVMFYDTGSEFDKNGTFVPKQVIKKDGTIGTVTDSVSSGLQTWYGDSYRGLVVQCLRDFWVSDTITSGNGTVEKTYNQGDIIKIGGDFYVVTRTGTQTIVRGKNQDYYETNGPLVKITNSSSNYIHVNELKTFNAQTYFQYRGFPVTVSNGDVYVYVGAKEQSYGITADFVATSTDDDGNPLFIKVGNTIEQVTVNVPQTSG